VFLLTQFKHLRLNIYQLCFTRLPFRGGGMGGGPDKAGLDS